MRLSIIQMTIAILLAILSFNTNAQHYGYLGKKNFLDIKSVSHSPILANFVYSFYDGDGWLTQWRYGSLNTGLYLTLGRTIKQNIAFSAEVGIDFMYFKDYEFNDMKVYNRSFTIMPKIEFSNAKSILPLGVSHQVGLGYFKLEQKNLFGDIEWYDEPLNGMTLMYCLNFRSAITKSIFLNYGLRYTYNYLFLKPNEFTLGYFEPSILTKL